MERRTEEEVARSDLPRYLRTALLHHLGSNNSFGSRPGNVAGIKGLPRDIPTPKIWTAAPRIRASRKWNGNGGSSIHPIKIESAIDCGNGRG